MKILISITLAVGRLVLFVTSATAQFWTQTGAPLQNWSSIASSADGTRLAAGGNSTFVSTNAGLTSKKRLRLLIYLQHMATSLFKRASVFLRRNSSKTCPVLDGQTGLSRKSK